MLKNIIEPNVEATPFPPGPQSHIVQLCPNIAAGPAKAITHGSKPAPVREEIYTANHIAKKPFSISRTASIIPTGGASPYSITLNGETKISQTGETVYFWGLSAGDYNFEIIDDNNCIFNSSITLSQPPVIQISDFEING